MSQTERELTNSINNYKWYHQIQVTDTVHTPPNTEVLKPIWDFILREMRTVDFNGKKVLDVGCRDGLFSFEAEKRGAKEVIGIDSDISQGATELLIPFLNSRVRMHKLNMNDLTPETFGTFDVILFFGVLYHLRYPVWGLKKLVDCLSDKGFLLIESGMLVDSRFENLDFMYCPVEESPYEPTSCTFFNQKALTTTMRSLGCKFIDCKTLDVDLKISPLAYVKSKLRTFKPAPKSNAPKVKRQLLTFQKDLSAKDKFLDEYWNGTHDYHTQHGT
ncbi:MAG: class I SAM-dependent methyltransferase [Pyrinomonadaceae bacterium MAG19_C2-C3]|nr:class I SAM-dependent methyltransferase [Pyrinomonadaceae bacterium MAG19_C2-C3]